jgi:hypothetical protein
MKETYLVLRYEDGRIDGEDLPYDEARKRLSDGYILVRMRPEPLTEALIDKWEGLYSPDPGYRTRYLARMARKGNLFARAFVAAELSDKRYKQALDTGEMAVTVAS